LSGKALQFLVLSVLYNQRTAFLFDGSSGYGQWLIVHSVLCNQRTAFLFDGWSVVKEVSDRASVFYYSPQESTCAMDSVLTCLYDFVVDSSAAMQKETSSSDVSSSSSSHVGRVRHRRRPNEVGYFTCHIVFLSWNFVPYNSGLAFHAFSKWTRSYFLMLCILLRESCRLFFLLLQIYLLM
jgi:hypothetical protein